MVKVKICGVTNTFDAKTYVDLGADFIGNIVDVPSSPRSITVEKSKEINSSLPLHAKGVVVMVPRSVKNVKEAVEDIRPWGVQLHGSEDLRFVKKVKDESICKVIKAIRVKDENSVSEAVAFSKICDAILLDTASDELGGSGKSHDWDISSCIVGKVSCDVFLAGGLNPENVKTAVASVSPFCVDVSSGVESSPGKKDPKKVRSFIRRAKNSA
jgi:phosphoribosylanthranilate isomerase